jgi:hypothetical protein
MESALAEEVLDETERAMAALMKSPTDNDAAIRHAARARAFKEVAGILERAAKPNTAR